MRTRPQPSCNTSVIRCYRSVAELGGTRVQFAITLTRDAAGRVEVVCPDVPAARAVGEYEADALANAQRALTDAFAACIRERRAIPRPTRRGRTRVAIPVQTQIKLAVYEAMRDAGVTRAELAR